MSKDGVAVDAKLAKDRLEFRRDVHDLIIRPSSSTVTVVVAVVAVVIGRGPSNCIDCSNTIARRDARHAAVIQRAVFFWHGPQKTGTDTLRSLAK